MEETLMMFDRLNDVLHRLHEGEQIQNAELLQAFTDLTEVTVGALNEVTALRREVANVTH